MVGHPDVDSDVVILKCSTQVPLKKKVGWQNLTAPSERVTFDDKATTLINFFIFMMVLIF